MDAVGADDEVRRDADFAAVAAGECKFNGLTVVPHRDAAMIEVQLGSG